LPASGQPAEERPLSKLASTIAVGIRLSALEEKSASGAPPGAPTVRRYAKERAVHYGVVIAADMATRADLHYRIALEVRSYGVRGRVGLIHIGDPTSGGRISSEIQASVRSGLGVPIAPDQPVAADLLILHAPASLCWTSNQLATVRATETIVVAHRAEDFMVPGMRRRISRKSKLTYAPINGWVRAAAPKRLKLATDDWRTPEVKALPAPASRRTRIAWLLSPGAIPPPETMPGEIDVARFNLDADDTQLDEAAFTPSLDRLAAFAAIVYLPPEGESNLPDALLQTALDNGTRVVLPAWLRPHYGKRPSYIKLPEQADVALRRATQDSGLTATDAPLDAAAVTTGTTKPSRPVMFLASNGVGVGHVNRLLAIARRLGKHIPAMFVTHAQAVGAIESFGYLTEYLPSSGSVGGSFELWDQWFAFQLEQLIDTYDPAVVVYDGNNPSDGLVRAVASRPDCRLAWVRRGLWGEATSPFLDNARWCDLIVEPGELAGQPDDGVTARRRAEAFVVPPIRLLDPPELLSREAAAKVLGLDPAKPAALIQLGAGYNRDIVSLIDELVSELQKIKDLQICIAEWVNGAEGLALWSGIKLLRGFPLSQYFRAFDFSIAAAGYNTFHDAIALGMPTIFIPNRHPAMDNQAARAEFAQSQQAAFEIGEDDLSDLPDLVTLLMDERARAFLVDKARQLWLENGAAPAADAIATLAETVR
jgi:UDP:flavonoid glycosyltransferase YjiC (YdhE family)